MKDAVTESGIKPPQTSTIEYKEVRVIREGARIIIPEGMSYADAVVWLKRQEEAEEKKVAILDQISCFPLDGIVAIMAALRSVYGFATLQDTPGFWGPTPPLLVQVDMGDGTFETAPLGRIGIPKWEGGFFQTQIGQEPVLTIRGEIKRKFEPEVKKIIGLARDFLKQKSIYKGRAVRIDLTFMEDPENHPFDPLKDSPQFIDTEKVDETALILNPVTESELRANIYTLIEQSEACQRNGIPLKHGALFMGKFGTGKTLTSSIIASKCVRNGWTFIYLKQVEHLANGLRLAQLYAPAVVFAEDIDRTMSGGRDKHIDEILNTMDGVDTKDKPIITILTTNNPEAIEPAFLRAGRIDTVISFGAPDAKSAERFVTRFARDDDNRSLLAPNTDLTEAGKSLEGFAPAFISEAVQKAKRLAIHREGADITGKVTGEDVALAAKALRKHFEMVSKRKDPTQEQIAAKALADVVRFGFGHRDLTPTVQVNGNGSSQAE